MGAVEGVDHARSRPRARVAGHPAAAGHRAGAGGLGGRAVMPPDPYGGRPPSSHERQASAPWDASYRDGPAPWDIGGPQPAVVRIAASGGFTGTVLDAGCGAGDNA